MRLLSLFPALFLAVGVSSATIFRANGTLTCHHHLPIWCFGVTMWEKDVSFALNTDDLIANVGVHCSNMDNVDYHIEGTQEDDGPLDTSYEVQVAIVHNCTHSDLRRATRVSKFISIEEAEVFLTWDLDVTHRGERVGEYEKAN